MRLTNGGEESSDSGSDSDYDAKAESKKILEEMETISRELVEESEFYSELHKHIKSEEFQSQLTRVLSSHSHDVPMVIYALDKLKNGQHYSDSMISFVRRMEYLEAIQKCIQEIKIHGNFSDILLDDLKDVTDESCLIDQFYELPFMNLMQYLEDIQKYTEEIDIPSLGEPTENILDNFSFHFFNVAPEIDMETMIQGI
ncbi:hypothetical protein REPUB_Repub11eG0013700 [Reevesia pubescens]